MHYGALHNSLRCNTILWYALHLCTFGVYWCPAAFFRSCHGFGWSCLKYLLIPSTAWSTRFDSALLTTRPSLTHSLTVTLGSWCPICLKMTRVVPVSRLQNGPCWPMCRMILCILPKLHLTHWACFVVQRSEFTDTGRVSPTPPNCWCHHWLPDRCKFKAGWLGWVLPPTGAAETLKASGDGSKPWYLVNPKIAGKWMFIPLKMYL